MKNKITLWIVLCVLFLSCLFAPLSAQSETNFEYELKAYFIYTFTRYIEWDNMEEDSTFIIGVIGNSKLIPFLQKIADNKLVKKRKITVNQWNWPEGIERCHILFIAESNRNRLAEILKKLERQSVLTIGDTEGFAQEGVCINFVVVGEKLKFEVNRESLAFQGLEVSSKLLKLAIIVD